MHMFIECSAIAHLKLIAQLDNLCHWVSALISELRSKGNVEQQCASSSPNSGEFLARPKRDPCSSVSWCHHTPHDVHPGACHPNHPHHPHHRHYYHYYYHHL